MGLQWKDRSESVQLGRSAERVSLVDAILENVHTVKGPREIQSDRYCIWTTELLHIQF
jgi:hypothetical protein